MTTSHFPSGVTSERRVTSSPPVSCTGNVSGPVTRHTCGVPVTFHAKYNVFPSGETRLPTGARTSSIAWIFRLVAAGRGFGAKRASTSGGTLSAPRPEYVAAGFFGASALAVAVGAAAIGFGALARAGTLGPSSGGVQATRSPSRAGATARFMPST
jgi:hypothetical protein